VFYSFQLRGYFESKRHLKGLLSRNFSWKEILKISDRWIVITDHSKYNLIAFAVFAKAEDIDILITDKQFEAVKILMALDIEAILA
jgi:DeoR/GlpR family transcriptional regulator of sugar metabolism